MRYEVKAMKGNEGVTALMLDAVDVADAAAQAKALGYAVIAVHARMAWGNWQKTRNSRFPLVLFSQELLALLDAGLALVDAIETLSEKEINLDVKNTLTQVNVALREGHTLSAALQQSGAHFPPLYVAMVRASEKTGDMSEALSRYIAYQTQMDGVKQQVVGASIYPVLLAVVGSIVTLFLMIYVVPRFSHVYADIGRDLPLMSRLLMNWGLLLEANVMKILAGLAILVGALVYMARRPAFKQWLDCQLWQLPTVGARLHVYQLARFYRSLGMLLRGGMPIVNALQMVSDLLRTSMRESLALALASIREGRSISQSMESHGLTTPVALRMLRVGERTGRMGEMMERIAAFYEEETARWVVRFTKLFEPLLMVFIGLIIGGIVVLMYFPIFELAGSIQ